MEDFSERGGSRIQNPGWKTLPEEADPGTHPADPGSRIQAGTHSLTMAPGQGQGAPAGSYT